MKRTRVVLDDELVERVKRLYGLSTTSAAIDFALKAVVWSSDRRAMLELEGMGWPGDLDGMSRNRVRPARQQGPNSR